MKNGYTEEKAFEMVEKEYVGSLEAKRAELRIIRGVAFDSEAVSYLDHYQRMAEAEARIKTDRLSRNIDRFHRAQAEWYDKAGRDERGAATLVDQTDALGQEPVKNMTMRSMEEVLFEKPKIASKRAIEDFKNPDFYQPVLYQIVNDPKELKEKETLKQIHQGFLTRTERLLEIFKERANVHDGLAALTD